jgi:ABC-type Mn2+/Zn2+ transport system ATPase subunit
MIHIRGSQPVLDIKGLWAGYSRTTALEDITFQVHQGEILGVIGPNGSGKSTLFKTVLGLLQPWRGDIWLYGQPSRSQRSQVGYVPQMETVDWDFPVTVSDVALMGRYGRLGLLRHPTKADRSASAEALERVGMDPLSKRLIGELSGGQRRRVLIARAIAHNPSLLLLDEPLAGLDATAQHQILDIIRDLQSEGTTVVLSTHDLSCVSSACHNAVCLNRYLVAYGAPEDVLTESVLGETFGTHLLLVHLDGQAYAYRHHLHNTPTSTLREAQDSPSPAREEAGDECDD